MLVIIILIISYGNFLRWPCDLSDEKSTPVQIMAWPSIMKPYDITRVQWVKEGPDLQMSYTYSDVIWKGRAPVAAFTNMV